MKSKYLIPVFLLFIGCSGASMKADRFSSDLGPLDMIESKYAYFSKVHVHVFGEEAPVELHGEIQSRWLRHVTFPGHINVSVFSPTGELIQEEEVPYRQRRIPRRTRRVATFKVSLLSEIPRGSTVRLAYHYGLLK